MRKLTHPARRPFREASIACLLLVLLGGCQTTGVGGWNVASSEQRALRLADNGDHLGAAGVYIGLATDATAGQRDRLTLLAAEQWLAGGDVDRARSAFNSVTEPASGPLSWLWQANAAAFLINDGKPQAALDILEPLTRQPLPADHRLRVEALRADAYFEYGEPLRGIEILEQREVWLDDADAVARNRQLLWRGMLRSEPAALRDAAGTTLNPEVRGWLTLGSLATTTGQQGIGWSNGIVRWRDRYPDHPAIVLLDDLKLSDEALLDYPRRIALLLPLSGRAASAGQAIQNGFLGAYFATAGGLDDRQSLRVYDVVGEGGPAAAYTAAVADGAEFVVGPLLKESVTELANDILVPVPVLTLNYLPDDTLPPPGLFQFALAPEDEAAAAAERAILDGHTRAVALVPNNSWGRRLLDSFSTNFEALGGTLLDYRSYTPANRDFSLPIEDLMALSGSVRRYQRLRANLGVPLQFDPRRRQDAEFIFLAADAPAGRLLKSQLKFHYSGDLPVYATSSVNAMDGRSNADLDGVRFADTPWTIAPQDWIDHLPDLYAEYWPQQRRLTRLHAMGYDAYHLVAPLFAVRGASIGEIDGATGGLRMDADGRIHRKLAWAEFSADEIVALPDPFEPIMPIDVGPFDTPPGPGIDPQPADAESWPEPTREL